MASPTLIASGAGSLNAVAAVSFVRSGYRAAGDVDCGRAGCRDGLTAFDREFELAFDLASDPSAAPEGSALSIVWDSDIGAANVDD
jgi:hypothetical protein